MKRLFTVLVLLLAVAAVGGLFGAPGTASARAVTHTTGMNADASFTYVKDACNEIYTSVEASTWTDTSPKAQGSLLQIQVTWRDVCGNVDYVWFGSTDAADVQISRQGASATGSLEMCDSSGGSCLSVDVSLDWQVSNPRNISIYKKTQVRMATATGTVVVAGVPPFNQTPDASTWAEIWTVQGG